MEKPARELTQRSQTLLKKYHQLTSPIVSLSVSKQQDNLKEELKRNVIMKLDCIKNRGSKIYALDAATSYAQLKASATLYQIPEFSTPEINYEVADQIKRKVEEMKNEIIGHLPDISRSSNYAPKKIEHQINHRSVVRELEEWLRQKLKNPPQNYEESVQYKNMIMGIGMKELIRIIGKRCNEEGRIAEEIWQLTWNICRQIIVYLSKRAKKCEELLQEELQFMRDSYEKEFERLKRQNMELTVKVASLEEQNKEFLAQTSKLKKRKQVLDDQNKTLTFDNFHLQEEFKNVLQENLAIYLQIGDKNKRGWIKKMYKSINNAPQRRESTFKEIYKKQINEVMEDRIKLEEVTEDCFDRIDPKDIEKIGMELEEVTKKKPKGKKKNSKKGKSKPNRNNLSSVNEMIITDPQYEVQEPQNNNESQAESSNEQCDQIVHNMRKEFLPVDAATSMETKQFIDAFASTTLLQHDVKQIEVSCYSLGLMEEKGVNTEEIKEQIKNSKKKGKQNIKEEPVRAKSKSKLYNSPPIVNKQKSKGKLDKDKKSILDVVHQQNQHPIDNKSIDREEVSIEQAIPPESRPENSKSVLSSYNKSIPKKNSFIIQAQNTTVLLQKAVSMMDSANNPLDPRELALIKNSPQTQQQSKNIQITVKSAQYDQFIQNEIKSMQKQIRNSNDSQKNHSTSLAAQTKVKEDASKFEAIKECQMYICAECNKIITAFDEKFRNPKTRNNKIQTVGRYSKNNGVLEVPAKRSEHPSPYDSLKKLSVSPEHTSNDEAETYSQRRDFDGRRIRRNITRKSSGYNHDIAFKKDMEEQMKSTFYNNDQTKQRHQSLESADAGISIYAKISPFKLLYTHIKDANAEYINSIANAQIQVTENLEHYFEMVKEINAISESKILMNQKLVITTIEKNIFPIINELLTSVKKAVKNSKISQTMKNFTSLPNIIYNRINRKYGVKILAIKNLKILLMALKAASRYTQKYKIIELMMFTDCKSPHSQDLFIYLLIMGLMDPTFSSNKVLTHEEFFTIRALCEEHLTKEPQVYGQFERLNKQQIESKKKQGLVLVDLIKSVITNYRLFKINRIEQLGFVFMMLKKDSWMDYKMFVYFLSALPLQCSLKIRITKKLLQHCDIKNKDQKIGITENMFSKFLMNCEEFSFNLLETAAKQQVVSYSINDKDTVHHLSQKFFQTNSHILAYNEPNQSQQLSYDEDLIKQSLVEEGAETPRQQYSETLDLNESIAIAIHTTPQQMPVVENRKLISRTKVLRQVKEYSSFTYQICNYLQNSEETKYLTSKQSNFIKDYLIVHLIENEVEKVTGIVDYFSNSMLQMICLPPSDFSIASSSIQPHFN